MRVAKGFWGIIKEIVTSPNPAGIVTPHMTPVGNPCCLSTEQNNSKDNKNNNNSNQQSSTSNQSGQGKSGQQGARTGTQQGAGRTASQIDRNAFKAEREAFWKAEAK